MLSLYIHIPFCKSKCPYCHFYSLYSYNEELLNSYILALLKEIELLKGVEVSTVYIGGGTPSILPRAMLEELLDRTFSTIKYQNIEATIEANPESVSEDFIKLIESYPISRVSLGVQSLDDFTLELLHRAHNRSMAIKAIELLLKSGKQVNTDIIFDILGVSNSSIKATLHELISFSPHHISAYSYDETDTGYLAGFDSDNTLFFEVEKILREKGYQKYEVSNFARSKEFESKHNLNYWLGNEYFGIGASAHSMLIPSSFMELFAKSSVNIDMNALKSSHRVRFSHHADLKEYIASPFIYDIEYLNSRQALDEDILTLLRLKKLINFDLLEKKFGKLDQNLLKNIIDCSRLGLVEWKEPYLKVEPKGEAYLEELSCRLLSY